MKHVISIAKIAALSACAFALVALGVAALSIKARIESDDVTGILANVTVVTRHANTTLDATDELVRQAKEATAQSITTQKALSDSAMKVTALVENTDRNVNSIVLPQLASAIEQNSKSLKGLTDQGATTLVEVSEGTKSAMDETTLALHNAAELLGDPHVHQALQSTANSASNVDKATANVNAILEALRHPEKPGKFIRALSFALSLLRSGGQTAPLFK